MVTGAGADADAATLSARLPYGDHPELLAGFPFPHELLVEVRLAGEVLTLRTTLRPTTDLRGARRLRLPPLSAPAGGTARGLGDHPARAIARRAGRARHSDRRHGGREHPPGPARDRIFDDLYPRLEDDPVFALEGAGRRVEVRFEQGYPVAQVYARRGRNSSASSP